MDLKVRLQYCERIQANCTNDANFIDKLIMGDEAHFHLNVSINRQNMRFCGTDNTGQQKKFSKRCRGGIN